MDPVMNQMARELADVVSTVVAGDSRVEACRDKARAAGYDMRVSLDAAITFVPLAGTPQAEAQAAPKVALDMTANDRRFLKSLRISADETTEKEVE
jgi:hypothetical protein